SEADIYDDNAEARTSAVLKPTVFGAGVSTPAHARQPDRPGLINRSRGSQRGARFFDPSGGVHFFEEAEGALDQSAVLQHIVTLAEPAVGEQRLRQLGP